MRRSRICDISKESYRVIFCAKTAKAGQRKAVSPSTKSIEVSLGAMESKKGHKRKGKCQWM
jgi:hypothetical protein